MKKHWCLIRIENGEIVNKNTVKDLFKQLQDGRYQVEVSMKKKRSTDQNSYYWLILTDFIQPALYDLGWREIKTKEDSHDFCSEMFLKVWTVNENTLERKPRVRSTTELSTVEFNTYLEEIWQWAAEYLQITIPAPNQQLTMIDDV